MELALNMAIPIIDLFAGPGGLGEGFSALRRDGNRPYFEIGLSIEKEKNAHMTLELRSFYRNLAKSDGGGVRDYYAFLRKDLSREELFQRNPMVAAIASREAWNEALGSGKEFDDRLDTHIERVTGNDGRWVLIGGPPCQAYSVIGRARKSRIENYRPENDERNFLYREYLRILARHQPAIFVMENVKGMLSASIEGKKLFQQIMADLKNPGAVFPEYSPLGACTYRIHSLVKKCEGDGDLKPEDYIVECEKYGIPQSRHRVILLGIRQDLDCAQPAILKEAEPVPASAVLRGLPRLRSGLTREVDCPANWQQRLRDGLDRRWISSAGKMWGEEFKQELVKVLTRTRTPLDDRGGEFIGSAAAVREDLKWWYEDPNFNGVCNHASRGHMLKDIYRYVYASCFAKFFGNSPKLHEFPLDLLPDHENVNTGHFDDRFRVQLYDRPATTVTCHISKDGHYYIHPDPFQCRSLTVREAARLQTFPDNYFFCGNRTQQYTQVGNAVPPLLAYKIALIVKDFLERV